MPVGTVCDQLSKLPLNTPVAKVNVVLLSITAGALFVVVLLHNCTVARLSPSSPGSPSSPVPPDKKETNVYVLPLLVTFPITVS